MADAQAICEAAQRPTMRFVTPKSAQAQGAAVIFRTRDFLVRQRTQLINALRGHIAEFGFIVAQGPGHVSKLIDLIDDPASDIPAEARPVLAMIATSLQMLQSNIAELDRKIAARSKADPVANQLIKVAARDRSRAGPWLDGMLARKPRMLVTVALANKIARIAWALMAHGGSYRAPTAVA